MSHSLLDAKEYALARNLLTHGIPLEEGELERMKIACLGLSIHGDGFSSAFNLPSGGAGYVFSVLIWNNSTRRLSPEHVVLDGLDWECRLHLLPDPREEHPMRLVREACRGKGRDGERDYLRAREIYAFPGPHLHKYPRESVLDYRIGPRRFLYPSDPPLEGFLLAMGPEPIPWDYAGGDRLKVRVRVFDQKGRSSTAWFHPVHPGTVSFCRGGPGCKQSLPRPGSVPTRSAFVHAGGSAPPGKPQAARGRECL